MAFLRKLFHREKTVTPKKSKFLSLKRSNAKRVIENTQEQNIFDNFATSAIRLEQFLHAQLQSILDPDIFEALTKAPKDQNGHYSIVISDKKDMIYYYQKLLNLLIDCKKIMEPISVLHDDFLSKMKPSILGKLRLAVNGRYGLNEIANELIKAYEILVQSIKDSELDTILILLPNSSETNILNEIKKIILNMAPIKTAMEQFLSNPCVAHTRGHGMEWLAQAGVIEAPVQLKKGVIEEEAAESFSDVKVENESKSALTVVPKTVRRVQPANVKSRESDLKKRLRDLNLPSKLKDLRDALKHMLTDLKGSEISESVQEDYESAIDVLTVMIAKLNKFLQNQSSLTNTLSFVCKLYPDIKKLLASLPQSLAAVFTIMRENALISLRQLNWLIRDWFLYLDYLESKYYLKDGLLLRLGQGPRFGLFVTHIDPALSSSQNLLDKILGGDEDAYLIYERHFYYINRYKKQNHRKNDEAKVVEEEHDQGEDKEEPKKGDEAKFVEEEHDQGEDKEEPKKHDEAKVVEVKDDQGEDQEQSTTAASDTKKEREQRGINFKKLVYSLHAETKETKEEHEAKDFNSVSLPTFDQLASALEFSLDKVAINNNYGCVYPQLTIEQLRLITSKTKPEGQTLTGRYREPSMYRTMDLSFAHMAQIFHEFVNKLGYEPLKDECYPYTKSFNEQRKKLMREEKSNLEAQKKQNDEKVNNSESKNERDVLPVLKTLKESNNAAASSRRLLFLTKRAQVTEFVKREDLAKKKQENERKLLLSRQQRAIRVIQERMDELQSEINKRKITKKRLFSKKEDKIELLRRLKEAYAQKENADKNCQAILRGCGFTPKETRLLEDGRTGNLLALLRKPSLPSSRIDLIDEAKRALEREKNKIYIFFAKRKKRELGERIRVIGELESNLLSNSHLTEYLTDLHTKNQKDHLRLNQESKLMAQLTLMEKIIPDEAFDLKPMDMGQDLFEEKQGEQINPVLIAPAQSSTSAVTEPPSSRASTLAPLPHSSSASPALFVPAKAKKSKDDAQKKIRNNSFQSPIIPPPIPPKHRRGSDPGSTIPTLTLPHDPTPGIQRQNR